MDKDSRDQPKHLITDLTLAMQHINCDTHFHISHLFRDLIQAVHEPSLKAFGKITYSLCQRSWGREQNSTLSAILFFIDFALVLSFFHGDMAIAKCH